MPDRLVDLESELLASEDQVPALRRTRRRGQQGDRLLGDGRGGLRMCPDSWMRYLRLDQAGLAEALRPLLSMPIMAVIVSHGEPVMSGGREAIAAALGEWVDRDR